MFDTMGLLEAQLEGPDAVIEQLRQGLVGSVGSFEELTVFQRKAIANASGLNEEEIRGLFNSKEVTEEQKKQAEEREKNLKAAMDLKAELMALVAEMSVALQPLLQLAKKIVSVFAEITKAVKAVMGEGTIGNIGAAAVMVTGGALIAKGVSAAMSKLGIGKKLGPGGVPAVYISGSAVPLGGGGGGGGDGDKKKKKTGGPPPKKPEGKKKNFFQKMKSKVKKYGKKIPGMGKLTGLGGAFGALKSGIGSKLKNFGMKGLGKLGLKAGLRFIPGIGQAMMAYDAIGAASRVLGGPKLPGAMFEQGGGIAGSGPVPITAHGGEVVVPVEKTPAASNLANMVAQKSAANNNELIKEIRNLNNRPIKVESNIQMDKQAFGRSINEHFGGSNLGSKPANSAV
jgi:hypothetical protein